MKKIQLATILAATMILGGCAEQVALVTGPDKKMTTTIEEHTFTQAAKDELSHAKRLGLISGDESTAKVADVFEKRGGYTVSLDRTTVATDKLLVAERKSELIKQCKVNKNDLALILYSTNVSKGSVAEQATIGRSTIQDRWTIDMLVCRNKRSMSFSALVVTSGSIYVSGDENRKVGESLASAILTEVGK